MAETTRSKGMVRSQLRVPSEVYDALQAAAAASGRSMNAEIVYRLQQSFEVEAQIDVAVSTLNTNTRELERLQVEVSSRGADLRAVLEAERALSASLAGGLLSASSASANAANPTLAAELMAKVRELAEVVAARASDEKKPRKK